MYSPNTNYITCHQLGLGYQFILPSSLSPGITPFLFSLPSFCSFPWWLLHETCTFTLFWLIKTSMSVKMSSLIFHISYSKRKTRIWTGIWTPDFQLFIRHKVCIHLIIFLVIFRYVFHAESLRFFGKISLLFIFTWRCSKCWWIMQIEQVVQSEVDKPKHYGIKLNKCWHDSEIHFLCCLRL